jgi:DNA modification methylase
LKKSIEKAKKLKDNDVSINADLTIICKGLFMTEKTKTVKREELNYALVEDTRPPIHTAMKYWGKKPHNIWRKYIENYTPENGIYLDPFAGSATSVFEAVKANRKVIAFDLNPLTSFIIEVFSSDFNKKLLCWKLIK